ncbi:zeta toxin family protein [Oceanobacillus saliphilus]|uniref:zeta toxin family protein n=1 Tax=Oceanobacillus saliphilus TaxID=2925834 RepID=UPI00201D6FEF|nr:zeta toxin family protein [Oceanobacillus saliphilus]
MENTTKEIFYINNEYNNIRSLLHQYIIETSIDNCERDTNTSIEKEAILVGGAPGAGKSKIVKDIIGTNKYVIIDADEIKSFLPEYTSALIYNKKSIAADLVHEESSDIANSTIYASIDESSSFLFDGTMKNTKKYSKLISSLKEMNYTVNLVVVDVDVDVALDRVKYRYNEPMGRFVPKEIVVSSNYLVAKSFLELVDQVDNFIVYSNSINGVPPKEIAACNESDIFISDQIAYDEFIEKSKNV